MTFYSHLLGFVNMSILFQTVGDTAAQYENWRAALFVGEDCWQ